MANSNSNNVSVIDTASNTVVATVAVGSRPFSLGQFVGGPNPPVPTPTLSEWAKILMAGLLLLTGLIFVQRRRA